MAHLDMVNIEDIRSENNNQIHNQPEINPREAISATPKKDNLVHRHFLIPAHYSIGHNSDKTVSDPRSELVNPSKKNGSSLDSIAVSQEPTSLVDIFLGHNSPFNIFSRDINS
ncbi:hypothetical protein DSO57_1019441 [Entomophthora muscae]|uniref:Uncharacterized protein n=1 Tax=Entomophthora muscae TaxID=34485 RepID=A0ACC2RVB0_9FUNG|nr:hypothetical protein DSO57_1019441 [Entomophthora muscae]